MSRTATTTYCCYCCCYYYTTFAAATTATTKSCNIDMCVVILKNEGNCRSSDGYLSLLCSNVCSSLKSHHFCKVEMWRLLRCKPALPLAAVPLALAVRKKERLLLCSMNRSLRNAKSSSRFCSDNVQASWRRSCCIYPALCPLQ